MEQIVEALVIMAVYVVELGALVILAGVIWWIGDLWLAHTARQRRRAERRYYNALWRRISR